MPVEIGKRAVVLKDGEYKSGMIIGVGAKGFTIIFDSEFGDCGHDGDCSVGGFDDYGVYTPQKGQRCWWMDKELTDAYYMEDE